MKKITALLSIFIISICMTACGNNTESSTADKTSDSSSQSAASEIKTENNIPELPSDVDENSFDVNTDTENADILVAYFSATGTTKAIAESIAEETGGDLYEITPAVPYTAEDLDYNSDCRANNEQNDKGFRTEISGTIDNFDDYEVVLIGYPIWWGEEPRIIDTFMDTYDLSGKTAAAFCTSGGSGISTSESNLKNMCPDAKWLDGKRFSGSGEVADWISELDIK